MTANLVHKFYNENEISKPLKYLTQNQITNCLLEVPQDIKYEITSDGKIILKAGSRVYVSTNGTFEAVTLTSDTAAAAGGLWTSDNSRKVFVVYMPHSNAVISQPVDYTFSQASAPTSFVGSSALWYDTTNRVLKCTWNNGANWYICSLPIMLGRPGIISSGKSGWAGVVDNVFNGMGFFGSTVWVGKGVKGLAPNRRNADGTLRNNLVVSKSVNFYTNDNYTTSRTTFVLFPDASVGRVTGGRYDASRNINVNSVGNDSIFCPIAEGSLSSGRITSFTPLQCFQAADAQNFVNKYNNEEVYGIKTFVNDTIAKIKTKNQSYDITNKQANQYCEILEFYDKNEHMVGRLDTFNPNSTATHTRIGVQNKNNKWSILEVVADDSNNLYAKCPASAVIGSILTTAGLLKSANGYVRLGNGLTLQWGRLSNQTAANYRVTLPIPYSSVASYVPIIIDTTSSTGQSHPSVRAIERTYFEGQHSTDGHDMFWLAIGY